MCVIYYKPENVKLSIDDIASMWDGNPHGGGAMWVDNGKISVVNGIMLRENMLEFASKVDDNTAIVFHFRISTGGGVTVENTQPFILHDNMAFCHNGILGRPVGSKSDTRVLADEFVAQKFSAENVVFRLETLAKQTLSSFAFIDERGIEMIGDWHKFDNGFASNMYWQTPSWGWDDIETSPWNRVYNGDNSIVQRCTICYSDRIGNICEVCGYNVRTREFEDIRW